MTNTANPLATYFRIPGLNVTLPTGGAFLPADQFSPNEDGTVPIFPMTAADEYLLKSPDALLSGYAIQKMLESCVPSIKNPSLISTPDLDVLLLAIRTVTYGENMDVATPCPKCKRENDFQAHLPTLIANVKPIPPEVSARLSDDVVAYLRPYSFANASQVSLMTYNETRRLQGVNVAEGTTDEIRDREQKISLQKITDLQNNILAACVVKVVTPDTTVEDPDHIGEFMLNIPRQWSAKIEEKINEMMSLGMDKNVAVKCQAVPCGHEWETQIEFDPSSFFG